MGAELLIQIYEAILVHVYYIVLKIIARIRPLKSWIPPADKFQDALFIKDEEYKEEERKQYEELFLFEASSASGDSILVSVLSTHTYLSATLLLDRDGLSLASDPITSPIYPSDDLHVFSIGPLRLEMREPHRKWRISFKGHMTSIDGSKHYVTIGGWWKATSNAQFTFADVAKSLRSRWLAAPFSLKENICEAEALRTSGEVQQWGEVRVEVAMDGADPVELRMRGMRERRRVTAEERRDSLSVYTESGMRLSWQRTHSRQHTRIVDHAYADTPDQFHHHCHMTSKDLRDQLLHFSSPTISTIALQQRERISRHEIIHANGIKLTIRRQRLLHMTSRAVALIATTEQGSGEGVEMENRPGYTASKTESRLPLLPFTHRACQDSSITGGKGSNLAKLTTVQNGFTVPRGLVVTTASFRFDDQLESLISSLADSGRSVDGCVAIGEKIATAIKNSTPSSELLASIDAVLQRELGGRSAFPSLAVRSSAVGEDGADLSSAGQLESVLNVDRDKVAAALLECWASNFRKEVLTYRRTYGQPASPPMAVVVQEMITDGCAGVLFTCDPVRLDHSLMVVNVIRGCGEDIVSGMVTPDEITIDKHTREVRRQPDDCVLSHDHIQQLVRVGLYLESVFGRAQDIEFVVKDGVVHVVQSRDVTGGDRESAYELRTEFDTACLTDKEIHTTANVGEVLAAPLCPLSGSIIHPVLDGAIVKLSREDFGVPWAAHYNATISRFNYKVFMNAGEMFLRNWETMEKDRLPEINVAGELLFTQEMFDDAKQRFGHNDKFFQLRQLYKMLKTMFVDSSRAVVDCEQHVATMDELARSRGTVLHQMLRCQREQAKTFVDVTMCHSTETMFSSFTYIIVAMLIRGEQFGGMTPSMQSDISKIFSQHHAEEVVSADVPSSLKKLARSVKADGLAEKFAAADTEEALKLAREGALSGPMLEYLMTRHGHRGEMELDVGVTARAWADHPAQLVDTIRTMLLAPDLDEERAVDDHDDADILDQLQCAPTGMRKWMMRYMVSQTHRGVSLREHCKNLLVKSSAAVRATNFAIAEKLVEEGYVCSVDLPFYLTMQEIQQLVDTRSPRLIARAMRRRTLFPTLQHLQYQHVHWGAVEPLASLTSDSLFLMSSLKGTTVCEGRVVARARVAKTLEEAADTQPGEVLVTRFTDICWSPLFPIVAGVVTEIGGLLSHGAVVAREYGLPSLIAVTHATDVFHTGDLVELNATKGTISKVQEKK